MINAKISNLQEDAEMKMKKCINGFKKSINTIFVNRVSLDMLHAIVVEYYGISTPLSQLTSAVIEQNRTLVLTVFDCSIIKLIEKSILNSKIGIVPVVHGNIIRITPPLLTEERRKFLIKMVRNESEKSKIFIRNIRRITNDKTKILLKNKEINEDEEHYFQNKIQSLTDVWIKKINLMLQEKELELMKF